jgi:hypothetical protein
MIEIIAGVLVAAAAVAAVLEPLFRRVPTPELLAEAEQMVNAAAVALRTECPNCGHIAALPAAYCSSCGTTFARPPV